jgi:aspartyl-tRNA synthetase
MRVYTGELKKFVGKEVAVAGWCHDVRTLGGINFLILRDKEGTVQVTAPKKQVKEEIIKIYEKLHQEDVVEVKGKVVKSKVKKIGIEIIPSELKVINKSETPLPLDPREVTPANLDTKLNWRVMWFRTNEARAIFSIQSQITKAFRDFFTERKYMEIQPPVIISSSSEGGAELFKLPYFEKQAYLAQSPQLYKQMCAISFEKVFMIVPVFRAERFDQPTHLNELRQMDMEQAFATDEDVIDVLEKCFIYILQQVKKNCEKELNDLKRELKLPKTPLKRVKYSDLIEKLKKHGEKIEWGEDFTKTQEKLLPKIVGEDAFFVVDWPSELKPFYAMPNEKNPKISRAFDLIHDGLEISSGTQRIHLPDLLIKSIKEKGMNPDDFKDYIGCFRHGAPFHSGWSIGLERITMTVTGKDNIREVTMFPRDKNRISP